MHKTEDYLKQNGNIVSKLFDVLLHYNASFAPDAFRVYFTSNHDENSWNGTEYEKYGNAAMLLSVFSCTWNGIAMIYSGQELPNYKRLKFFDKDQIEWIGHNELHDFYKTLLTLRKTNNALRAGDPAVNTMQIPTGYNEKVFAFLRSANEHAVLVVLNFSSEKYEVEIKNITGKFKNIYNNYFFEPEINSLLSVEPWGYFVFEKTD
jgi:glycosidase